MQTRYTFFSCCGMIICGFIGLCSEVSGDREVQRTMLELLNQLDGFSSDERIKVCIRPQR
jgi:hypothetical protein